MSTLTIRNETRKGENTMNYLIAVLFLTLSFTTFANSELVNYRFGINHTEDFHVYRIYEVTLKSNKKIEVHYREYKGEAWEIGSDELVKEESYVVALSELKYELLKVEIVSLSNTEIETQQAEMICHMFPSPVASNDHLSVAKKYNRENGEFEGPLEITLSVEGCWEWTLIRPTRNTMLEKARTLKNMIKVLALR